MRPLLFRYIFVEVAFMTFFIFLGECTRRLIITKRADYDPACPAGILASMNTIESAF